MKRDLELEATIVEKFAAVEAVLDERGRRLWAAAEARAIGYGAGQPLPAWDQQVEQDRASSVLSHH